MAKAKMMEKMANVVNSYDAGKAPDEPANDKGEPCKHDFNFNKQKHNKYTYQIELHVSV